MATLKISELSVGDWVKVRLNKCDYNEPDTFKAKVLSVVNNSVGVGYDKSGIVMSALVEDLHPIPITAEMLEKNGFEKNGEYNEWSTGNWDDIPFIGISLSRQSMRIKNLGTDIFIENKVVYVHQLQRALSLANIDKEITL